MQSLPPLIFDLAIMLGLASIITLFFQRIGQPVVLGYLIAGIIIGPYTPPHILVDDIPNIKILSELGVIFLIFFLGLEFSFHKLVRVGFSASISGILEVILMTIIGFGLGKMMGWSFNNALFLGAALSISSSTIIIKALEELNMSKKRFAELIFGILIVEDLFAILLLVILAAAVTNQNLLSLDMLWTSLKLILVIGGWFIVGYFFIPTFHRKIIPYANEESLTIVSVSLCLLLVSLSAYLHYSLALGAFIMGSVISETHAIHKIKKLIKPIRDVFAAVFFIATGMLMDPRIIIEHWPTVLIITAVTILGKILCTALSSFFSGQNLNTSIRVGFGMAQIGEFSFIIVGLGLTLKVVNEMLYPIIVAVSIITTFTTPYLIRFSSYLLDVLDRKLSAQTQLKIDRYSTIIFPNLSVHSKSVHAESAHSESVHTESVHSKTVSPEINHPHSHQNKVLEFRLILNGILVAILFTLSRQLVFPWLNLILKEPLLAKTLCWAVALLLSSPFLWGMIFSSKEARRPFSKKTLNIRFLIKFLLTMMEVILLSLLYFKTWPVILSLFFITITFLIVTYPKLQKTYLWLEAHLKKNLKYKNKKVN